MASVDVAVAGAAVASADVAGAAVAGGVAMADAAAAVLRRNCRGDYSVPTGSGLYPMQFNWDSAFAAIGYGLGGDGERGWRELETLADAQWADGMLPHIVFRGEYQEYFPGPAVWQAGGAAAGLPPSLFTSGLTNPPVAAIAAAMLQECCPLEETAANRARMRRLLRALAKWHEWIARYCLHGGGGAFVAVHPWESGRDNACDWDAAFARVLPRDGGLGGDGGGAAGAGYTRSDTKFVAAAQRPLQADYDRYLEIVACGRECGWRAEVFRQGKPGVSAPEPRGASPFQVMDPGITAILAHANDALCRLLRAAGMEETRRRIAPISARARRGLAFLWNDAAGGYTAFDVLGGRRSDCVSSAAFLAPLGLGGVAGADEEAAGEVDGGGGDGAAGAKAREERRRRHAVLMENFDRIGAAVNYAVPSADPAHDGFSPLRYWRGPVWLPLNMLIHRGLVLAGETARAGRVRDDSLALVKQGGGFFEYYHPHSGQGLGGGGFTWTAAAALYFLRAGGEAAGVVAGAAA